MYLPSCDHVRLSTCSAFPSFQMPLVRSKSFNLSGSETVTAAMYRPSGDHLADQSPFEPGRSDSECGLTPEDEPLILRDIGTSEIYALDVDWP
jgi:hypothetical protein